IAPRSPRRCEVTRITIVYDATCPLCVRCAEWIATEPQFVSVELLPSQSERATARYGAVPWLGQELVAVSDDGAVWAGPAAFLVALWTLERWREWSYVMSGDTFSKMAERFFYALSHKRR